MNGHVVQREEPLQKNEEKRWAWEKTENDGECGWERRLAALLPQGGHLQQVLIADLKGLLVLFADALVDFLTIHADMLRHIKADFYLAALYLEDADTDGVANVHTFARAPAQYQHTLFPLEEPQGGP